MGRILIRRRQLIMADRRYCSSTYFQVKPTDLNVEQIGVRVHVVEPIWIDTLQLVERFDGAIDICNGRTETACLIC